MSNLQDWIVQEIVAKTKQLRQAEQALDMTKGALSMLRQIQEQVQLDETISVDSKGPILQDVSSRLSSDSAHD